MKPIRMCLTCRNRTQQDNLNRFQCIDKQLVSFTNIGRSFYICKDCLNRGTTIKKILKLCGNKKAKDEFLRKIEEIVD